MADIFLSSSFVDLQPYREAAASKLRQAGRSVDEMGGFPSGDSGPVDVCQRRVRQCELYVGILAWRYGTPEPTTGKSVTEIEYWTAVNSNLECLFFLVDPEQPWKEEYRDKDQAALESFKNHAKRNHTVAFFRSPDDLAASILVAVAAWSDRRSLAARLKTAYPETPNFHVVAESAERLQRVYAFTAHCLLKVMEEGMARDLRVVLGLAGGPLTRHIADELQRLLPGRFPQTWQNGVAARLVTVVSLNDAVESNLYQNCANYQVARLSEILNVPHLAANHDGLPEVIEEYERTVQQVNVLLCSCGDTEGWLMQWLTRKVKATDSAASPDLHNVIGDFCLTPIDADGCAVPFSSELDRVVARIAGYPHPRFDKLMELRVPGRTIIFPVVSERRLAAHVILSEGVADHCIISESTAKELLRDPQPPRQRGPIALCDFLLYEPPLGFDGTGTVYRAEPLEPGRVRVIETGRRPRLYTISPQKVGFEIILSDPPVPAPLDATEERDFPVMINDRIEKIALKPGVRKPGNWAATAIRVAVEQLAGRPGPRILDLGCGSGVIGIHCFKLTGAREVIFSDIDSNAVNCAKLNAIRQQIREHNVKVGDLFEPLKGEGAFDLIVFGAPFYPELPDIPYSQVDTGGPKGHELAQRFVEEVEPFLVPGGCAITYLPDFIDGSTLFAKCGNLLSGIIEKYILYPFDTLYGFPQSNEIRFRKALERTCHYQFAEDNWRKRRFLRFKMRFYVFKKPRTAAA